MNATRENASHFAGISGVRRLVFAFRRRLVAAGLPWATATPSRWTRLCFADKSAKRQKGDESPQSK